MPKVLHLYNVLGALTETSMLNVSLGLQGRSGIAITFGYETLAPEAPALDGPMVRLDRIEVEPTRSHDAAFEQMDRIARRCHAATPTGNAGARQGAGSDPAMRYLLDDGFDLVHGHFGTRVLHAAPFLARGKAPAVPTVISCYGYDVARLVQDESWVWRYQWAADRGATFVALAQSMFVELHEMGLPRERMRLIRLGIDLDRHPYTPAPACDPARFVFAGRFTPKKGPLDAIEAFAAASRLYPMRLDLIGDGELRDDMVDAVQRLGLGDRVRFLGRLPFDAMLGAIASATAFVLPSVEAPDGDREGAPMVLMHAAALGTPCITTRHAGNPEVLPPELRRFAVDEQDTQALAEAMADMAMLNEAERRYTQDRGRRWIEQHFDLRRTIRQYADLYEELLRGGA